MTGPSSWRFSRTLLKYKGDDKFLTEIGLLELKAAEEFSYFMTQELTKRDKFKKFIQEMIKEDQNMDDLEYFTRVFHWNDMKPNTYIYEELLLL